MASYEVFNPECDAARNGEIGPTVHINQLDPKTQAWIEQMVRMAIPSSPLGDQVPIELNYRAFEDSLQDAMGKRICDIEEILPTEKVLDAWARNNSFEPENIMHETAGWLAYNNAGGQRAYIVELVEDLASPNGKSWEIREFTYIPAGAHDGNDMWEEETQANFWGYSDAFDVERAIMFPQDQDYVTWFVIPVPSAYLVTKLDILNDNGEARQASSQEIRNLIKLHAANKSAESADTEAGLLRYSEENIRLNQEVDALNSEIEKLKADLTEYKAREIQSENLLIERDKQIESLKERLSAYEDVAPARLSDLAEKPEYIDRLSIFDMDHMTRYENGTGKLVYEAYDYRDERASIHIEPSSVEGAWNWDLNANGTVQMGAAGDPVGAIAEAKRAYAKLVAPPPPKSSQQLIRNDAQLFPHPAQLEISTEQHGSENLTVYSYGWDSVDAPLQVQFAHSSVTDDYSWQATLFDNANATTAFKAGVNATFEDAYVAASAELAAVNPSTIKVQSPLHPGDPNRATSIDAVRNAGELKPPVPSQGAETMLQREQSAVNLSRGQVR